MSHHTDTVMLPIASVILDERLRPRVRLDPAAVAEYAALMKAEFEFPPCQVVRVDGRDFLCAGWLRYHATKQLRNRHLCAVVRTGTFHDALLLAASENSVNAFRLTLSDTRRAISLLLADPLSSAWTDADLARHVGTVASVVAAERKRLEASEQEAEEGLDEPEAEEQASEPEPPPVEAEKPAPPPPPRLTLSIEPEQPPEPPPPAGRRVRTASLVLPDDADRLKTLGQAKRTVAKLRRQAHLLGMTAEALLARFPEQPPPKRPKPQPAS